MTTVAVNRAGGGALWPYAGFAALVLGIVATWAGVFLLSEDELKAGGLEFREALDSGGNEAIMRVTAGLGFLAAGFLVAFAVGFRRALELRAPESTLPRLIELSLVVTAAIVVVAAIMRAMVFDTGLDYYNQEAASTLYALSVDVGLAAWGAVGLAAAATAFLGLRDKVLPFWFGAVSAGLALTDIPLALTGTPFPMNFIGFAWLLLASVVSLRLARD
jgi:hypothetical protein